MADEADQTHIADTLSEARSELSKAVETAKGFWRTKRAIDRGTPLHDWSHEELKAHGYMRPWTFTSMGAAITGGIAAVTTNY